MNAYEILARGYLPKELPPPFNSLSLASALWLNRQDLPQGFAVPPKKKGKVVSSPAVHSLARAGILRRRLSIPNPINYFQLARAIEINQQDILVHVNQSKFSLTTPQADTTSQRAIMGVEEQGYRPIARSLSRASSHYILKTDIDNFYPSIYTHAIPWALHGKLVAKQNRSKPRYYGNVLDQIIRNSQDQQTLGIHIGPDCSLVVAEIILSAVDIALLATGLENGFRYLDDYEFGFGTYSQAQQALADLQGELSKYELHLNPRKTHLVELPSVIEDPWATELRKFRIRADSSGQEIDLIGYFSRAYELQSNYPDESVLSFALGKMRSLVVSQGNWPLYQSALLQIATIEPGTLSRVVDELYRYHLASYSVDLAKVSGTLQQIICHHAKVNHGSEVAWAVWGCILFRISLDDSTASELTTMEDSVIAILALDARAKGLIGNNANLTLWSSMMNSQALYEENWLLAYEANVKGWLPSIGSQDHVADDQLFDFLKQNSVRIYNAHLSSIYKPSGVSVISGAPSEGLSDTIQFDLGYG